MRYKQTLSLLAGFLLFALLWTQAPAQATATVFINEIHYDNVSGDVNEGVEIAGPAGTDLSNWQIVLYNGDNSKSYGTINLAGTIPDQCGGYGTLSFLRSGIQNGAPDGLALVDNLGTVIQFLSYEGSFTAIDGPAATMTSTNMGVYETGSTPATHSLQLTGSGSVYSDFSWQPPATSSFGSCNTGQTFGVAVDNPPQITTTIPVDNAIDVSANTTITLNFSESVDLTANGVTLTCGSAISLNGLPDSDVSSVTLTPAVPLPGNTTCTVTAVATQITDKDGTADPLAGGDYTFTFTTAAPITSPIIINEVDADTPGTDTAEFVELYDGGSGDTSLAGHTLVFYNGSDDTSYKSFDLDDEVTDANGYFVIGNTTVPNVDLTFANGSLQNGADAIALYQADSADFPNGTDVTTANLIDALVYDTDDGDDAGLAILLNAAEPQIDEDANQLSGDESNQRCANGSGGRRNTSTYLQNTPSPGETNDCDFEPFIIGTNPADGAVDVALDTTVTITFNELVDAAVGAFSLECPSGTPTAFTSSPALPASSTSFVLTLASNLTQSTACTGTVTKTAITDQDATLDNMEDDYTFIFNTENPVRTYSIHEIQGSGSSIAFVGTVTVEGVVVGDYQESDELQGFFLQEETSDIDADTATSEGIYVYCGWCTTAVSEGQIVEITGIAEEYFGNSQIDVSGSGSNVTVTDTGDNSTSVTPAAIDLPVPIAFVNVDDYYEQFEGMLVNFVDELTVTEYFELARYGQIVLSEGGKTQQFTHLNIPSVAGYTAHLDEMARRRIILDDTNNRENDTDPIFYPQTGGFSINNYVRGGYTIPALQGVLDYSWAGLNSPNAFRVRPQQSNPVAFTASNTRPAAPTANGEVSVASFNVLNYFNGDGMGGDFPTTRGADSAAEFTRQHAKIVNAILTLDADIIGLMEIENDGFESESAIQELVDGLNAIAGKDTYAFINAGGFIGTDEIAVGMLYQTAVVTPTGTTAVLDDPAFVNPFNAATPKNRAALAQTFQVTDTDLQSYGGVFTVVVNHLKSKGSSCGTGDDDTTTGQGNCNGTRTAAAAYLVNNWLTTDPTNTTAVYGFHDTDYLIIGDLNAYALENPITTITGAGFTNLLGTDAYSYVFSGEWGYLDHALASSSLVNQVQSAAHWGINADESSLLDYNDGIKDSGEQDYEAKPSINPLYENNAYRSSDHDPLIVGINPTPTADYGDLASSYGNVWHTGFGELRLGNNWSAEEKAATNDADDGIQIGPGSGPQGQWQDSDDGGSLIVTVNDTSNSGETGCFYAWIDWNHNGTFEDPGERVISNEEGGSGTYSFTVPDGTFLPPPDVSTPLTNFAIRGRLYAECSSGPTGQGFGGEVEDLSVDFTPTAVSLQSFSATNQNTVWLAGLLVVVTLLAGSLLIWKNGRFHFRN